MSKYPIYHVYCDESRQTKDQFMVLGGTVIEIGDIPTFESAMNRYRSEYNMNAELKWSKVSVQKLTEYKIIVSLFFELNKKDNIHFHCIIIDNHRVNHKKFNQGDYELGFYKFYYQLLLHCFGKLYCTNKNQVRLIIHPDHRQSRFKLISLLDILNRGIRKKNELTYDSVLSIEPVDSKESNLMQISDIILGAIGFQKNGYNLSVKPSKAKVELSKYIAEKAGLIDLLSNTRRGDFRFTIWNFRLRN